MREHDTADEDAWYRARRGRPRVGDLIIEDCEDCIADMQWLDWLERILPSIPDTGLPDGAFGDLEWLRARTMDTRAYEGATQAASVRDLRVSVAQFADRFPGVLPDGDLTITLGVEFDAALNDALDSVLSDLGGVMSDRWAGIGGSQEVVCATWLVSGRPVIVENETYMGTSIRGAGPVVRRIAAIVADRVKSRA